MGSGKKWLGINDERFFMHDGWHVRDVRELLLNLVGQVHEGFEKATPFTAALLRYLGIASYRDYVNHVFFAGNKRPFLKVPAPRRMHRYHSLPIWLGAQAARSSPGALRVLDEGAIDVVAGIKAVMGKIGFGGRSRFDIVLSGSVLANIPAYQRAVARRIRGVAPAARIVPARARPIRGALNYAAHRAWGGFPPGSLREKQIWY